MLLSYYIFSEKFNHNVFSIVLQFFQIYLNCSIVNKNYLIVWKCKENLKQFNANFELKILNSFSEWIYWRKLDSVIPHLKYIICVKWTETSIKYKLYINKWWYYRTSLSSMSGLPQKNINYSMTVARATFLSLRQYLTIERPLKVMKNVFIMC